MLTQQQLEVLLNRPLSEQEVANIDLYFEITEQRLAELLCMSFETGQATRSYLVREGYRTVFTEPFTGTPIVRVNGKAKDPADYTVRQGDSLNGSWHNAIVFKKHLARDVDVITIEADYGFGESRPADFNLLIARTFAETARIVTASDTPAVASKQIEDFRVTYDNSNSYEAFMASNGDILSKYSLCSTGAIRHGRVYPIYY